MINVLICDESMSDAEDLLNILDYSYGTDMRTRVFYKSSDALSYIRCGSPVDLCFFELVMPEMNGIELASALRSRGYNGNIVFISRDKNYSSEAYGVQALDYLLKPTEPQDVRNTVEKWIIGRKPILQG